MTRTMKNILLILLILLLESGLYSQPNFLNQLSIKDTSSSIFSTDRYAVTSPTIFIDEANGILFDQFYLYADSTYPIIKFPNAHWITLSLPPATTHMVTLLCRPEN